MPSKPHATALLELPAQAAPPADSPGGTAPPGPDAGDPAWAGLRLVTVPGGWPPYDCERHGAACPAADAEAGTQPPEAQAAQPPAGTRRQPPGGEASADGAAAAGDDAARGSANGALADRVAGTAAGKPPARGPEQALSAAWLGQFAQVLAEVVTGYRPAKQLVPLATEQVRAQVDLLSCAVATGQRPRIRRVMTSRPAAGVVEMTMVVSFGSRSRALAMRFEHVAARPPAPGRPARPARWLCTEIETSYEQSRA